MPGKKKPTPVKKALPFKVKGPYLIAAVLCDNLIEEKDGTLSLIRIVDKFTLHIQHFILGPQGVVGGETPPAFPPTGVALNLHAVVLFKEGRARGRHTLKIIPRAPDGEVLGEVVAKMPFTAGGDRGNYVRVPMGVVVKTTGLHWVDVLLDGELVTRIPFRVEWEESSRAGTAQPATGQPARGA